MAKRIMCGNLYLGHEFDDIDNAKKKYDNNDGESDNYPVKTMHQLSCADNPVS